MTLAPETDKTLSETLSDVEEAQTLAIAQQALRLMTKYIVENDLQEDFERFLIQEKIRGPDIQSHD